LGSLNGIGGFSVLDHRRKYLSRPTLEITILSDLRLSFTDHFLIFLESGLPPSFRFLEILTSFLGIDCVLLFSYFPSAKCSVTVSKLSTLSLCYLQSMRGQLFRLYVFVCFSPFFSSRHYIYVTSMVRVPVRPFFLFFAEGEP